MLRSKWKRYIVIGLLLLLAIGGWKFFRSGTQEFASDLERFKYGSMGADKRFPFLFGVMGKLFSGKR